MTHATPRPLKLHVDDDGYVCTDDGKTVNINALPHRDLIVHAVNTLDEAKAALELARELLNDSNVRHYVSTKLGEQAKLHRFLNTSQATLAKLEGGAR